MGGDKTGDARFYEWFVPKCEAIWEEYLDWLEKQEQEEPKGAAKGKADGKRGGKRK
ncbi:MAG TPA: hypothetical protein V6D47_02700 [Oscillatoriaceae cyanobacterium]